MSANLHAALADLRARRDAYDAAVRGLEIALGLEGTPIGPPPAAAPVVTARRKASEAKPGDETSEAILACLRLHGPLSPKELMKRAKISAYILTSRLKQLGSRVVVTGSTNDRMIALPGQAPAKEAP